MARRAAKRKSPPRPRRAAAKREAANVAPNFGASGNCPIVAMGASAGGLEAFERFFARMPQDSGMAFVLVPHLDAKHKSAMSELLQRYTEMPVVEITDGMASQVNRAAADQTGARW
jgi:two-component system, chemotaxis family, CheB/CheR fusion protein